MVVEITAMMQSVRALTELMKANKSLANFNELVAAVSEVNAKLVGALAVALESQEKQAALSQRIRELEKEKDEAEDWNRETERYQLAEISPSVFAYVLKPGMEDGEPSHHLCANCFTKKEKSILQLHTYTTGPLCMCPRCKEAFPASLLKRSS